MSYFQMNLFGSFEHQFQQDLVWWLFRVDFRPQRLRLKKIALGKPVRSSAQKIAKLPCHDNAQRGAKTVVKTRGVSFFVL